MVSGTLRWSAKSGSPTAAGASGVSASSPVVSAQVFVGLGGGADDSWPPACGRSRSPIGTRDSGLLVLSNFSCFHTC